MTSKKKMMVSIMLLGIIGLVAGAILPTLGQLEHLPRVILASIGAILLAFGGVAEGYVLGTFRKALDVEAGMEAIPQAARAQSSN